MRALPQLMALAISLITLLQVLLDGAKERASDNGDLETLCMLMSIGNDVTSRYSQLNPEDLQVRDRLGAMRSDLSLCQALLDEPRSL